MARLTLFCLIHPRQDVGRMEVIDRIVKSLGWQEDQAYGIVLDHIGYTVGCEWSGEKQSPESAVAGLSARGVLPSEFLVCTSEDAEAVRIKRRAEGYYDELTCHG
jgi:hypothetical protein